VLALSPEPGAIGFFSRYVTEALICPDPGHQEAAFLDFMEQLGRRLNYPGVLFLTRDQDVSAVGRNRARLERHFCIPFANWAVLSRIVDKQGQYAVAQDVGVPLPLTHFPQDETEVIASAESFDYPAIIKPAYHVKFSERFGVKGFVTHDAEQMVDHYRRGVAHGYRMMIQEVIPGKPHRLYTYGSYLNRRGEALAEFTGRKLRQNPRMFGTCRMGECCPAPEVAALGLRLLRALDFWGISQVEFKLDPRDGQFKLIEVNARNYQWQHLATVCGANLAYVAYQDALDQAVAPHSATVYGKRWVLAASDLVLTPREILRGQTSLSDWLRSWRGVAVDGIFSWRDPRPGLHFLGNRISRLQGERP
jgi:predicted ATP-grasp superfamily ATP-dependent carboligase